MTSSASQDHDSILLTGGTGQLGREWMRLLSGLTTSRRRAVDIVQPYILQTALDRYTPQVIVHAAAYTDVAGAERDRAACWQVNVLGTRHLVAAVRERGMRLVYISTDYVFYGDSGQYK